MKKLILLIIVAIILVIAAITNPSKADYVTFRKDEKIEKTDNSFEKIIISKYVLEFLIVLLTQKIIYFSLYIPLKWMAIS